MSSYSACGFGIIYCACVVLYAAIGVHVISRFENLQSFAVSFVARWTTDCEADSDCMPTTLRIHPVHVDNIASEARDFCGT